MWNQGDRQPNAEENPKSQYCQRLGGQERPLLHWCKTRRTWVQAPWPLNYWTQTPSTPCIFYSFPVFTLLLFTLPTSLQNNFLFSHIIIHHLPFKFHLWLLFTWMYKAFKLSLLCFINFHTSFFLISSFVCSNLFPFYFNFNLLNSLLTIGFFLSSSNSHTPFLQYQPLLIYLLLHLVNITDFIPFYYLTLKSLNIFLFCIVVRSQYLNFFLDSFTCFLLFNHIFTNLTLYSKTEWAKMCLLIPITLHIFHIF